MSVLAVVKLLIAVAKTTVEILLTAGGKLRPKPRVRAGYVSIFERRYAGLRQPLWAVGDLPEAVGDLHICHHHDARGRCLERPRTASPPKNTHFPPQ